MSTRSALTRSKENLKSPWITQQPAQVPRAPTGKHCEQTTLMTPIRAATRTFFAGQTYDGHLKTRIGGQRSDKFIIKKYISGKPTIVIKHVNNDGTINWGTVAGENQHVHDHWTEFIGYVQIHNFSRQQGDTLQVRGHTVSLKSLEVIDGDTLIVVQSQQRNGSGAHDEDVLGFIVVKRVALTAADIQFTGTNDGVAKTWTDFQNLVAYYDLLADSLPDGELIVRRRGNSVPMFAYPVAHQTSGQSCGCGYVVCNTTAPLDLSQHRNCRGGSPATQQRHS